MATIVTKVLRRGQMTLTQIVKETSLPEDVVKKPLFDGIQHNFVFTHKRVVTSDILTSKVQSPIYSVLLEHLLARLQFPHFISFSKDMATKKKKDGRTASLILQELLLLGRKSPKYLFSSMIERPGNEDVLKSAFERVFDSLVQSGHVKQVSEVMGRAVRRATQENWVKSIPTQYQSVINAATEDKDELRKHVSSKLRHGVSYDLEEPMVPRKRNLFSEAKSHQERKQDDVFAEGVEDEDDDEEEGVNLKRRATSQGGRATKRMRPSGKAKETVTYTDNDRTLYMVNYRRFDREIRKTIIIGLADNILGDDGAYIMQVMFKMAEETKQYSEGGSFPYLNEGEVIEQLCKERRSGMSLTKSQARTSLELLRNEKPPFLTKRTSIDSHEYAVLVDGIIQHKRKSLITNMLFHKLSRPSVRMFRIIDKFQQLDLKSIADHAILPVEDARKLLYTLFAKDYVQLQEVPRTSDHVPSRTIFLWNIRWLVIRKLLLGESYAAAANMLERLRYADEKCAPIFQKLEVQYAMIRNAGDEVTDEDRKITEEALLPSEKRLLEKHPRLQSSLHTAVLDLASSITVLCDNPDGQPLLLY
eukprot:TRINITY_DN3981_c0_g1_i1.p1 TRINITY_DN3981_c0_g1~~TRINITY_DN3981_c0_g1_i1.p1  ORF type:complete len:606 (-),score=138.61 TRINITY_DN3981_c0_g1_i1:182-1945(-)